MTVSVPPAFKLEGASLDDLARAVLDIVGVSRGHIAAAVGDDEGRFGGIRCADAGRSQLGRFDTGGRGGIGGRALVVGDGQGQHAVGSAGGDGHCSACIQFEGASLDDLARAVLDIVGVSRGHIAAAVGDDEGRLGGIRCADADRSQLRRFDAGGRGGIGGRALVVGDGQGQHAESCRWW